MTAMTATTASSTPAAAPPAAAPPTEATEIVQPPDCVGAGSPVASSIGTVPNATSSPVASFGFAAVPSPPLPSTAARYTVNGPLLVAGAVQHISHEVSAWRAPECTIASAC